MSAAVLNSLALRTRLGDEAAIADALATSAEQQTSAVALLLEKHLVDENAFLHELAAHFQLPWWDAPLPPMDEKLRHAIPGAAGAPLSSSIRSGCNEHDLYLLTYDPFNLTARQVIAQEIKEPVTWCVATRRAILGRVAHRLRRRARRPSTRSSKAATSTTRRFDLKQEVNVLDEEDPEATVVSFVNQIMREALEERATDIHVEPLENDLRIRYRIDGVLHEVPVPSKIKMLQASVISRIKIMAQSRHRRAPHAAGRPHQSRNGGPADRRPRGHHPHRQRREHQPAAAGAQPVRLFAARPHRRGGAQDPRADRAAQRHHPAHRPDRLRQEHVALHLSFHAQHDGAAHRHGRGPGRAQAARRDADRGQARDRPHLRHAPCAAFCAATPTSS